MLPILQLVFRIGWNSVCERGRAVFALLISAAFTIVAYYLVPGVREWFEPFGRWQRLAGWRASFAHCAIFCGLIPYAVYRVRRGSEGRHPLVLATAQAVWCGLCGVACGWFFALQGRWFGVGHDLFTVLTKVTVDQFVWSVLVIVPANAVFYAVLSGGWKVRGERVPFGVFLVRVYLPNLLLNWVVWIPSNCAVYAFPMDLQIPALGLLSSAWAVICVGLGARSARAIRASSCPSDGGR